MKHESIKTFWEHFSSVLFLMVYKTSAIHIKSTFLEAATHI